MSQSHSTAPDGIIRSAELRAAGMSGYAVSARCRPSGPWRRVLPGVVLMGTGPPTRRQWLRAAIAYAGPGAVLTGADALCLQGIEVPRPADVLVLMPAARRAAGRPRLIVERTTRPPEPVWREGLPLAPVVRATADAARREHDHDRLRALLLAPVLAGACTIPELLAELTAGSQRGTAAARGLLLDRSTGHQYSSGSLPSMSRT
ncbi:MAG TPA: hypothetical protein VGX25_18555 [Actinophytocola sp.]|uniref:hypothetical protein n=1 Tax=Actinophytocola sp. TaxID=1872138 RepID=UPI002DDCDE97|nr:hypothetical protein [Actinophytocola sp.]HEV2781388.1 hypothetical protein [Actinophytocola sp.]